jgi:hypothetical protein
MNGYELSRNWFNWCFDNPEKIKPIHSAIFFFAVEHCNRLGGKYKFGFPSQMTMEAIGVRKYQTYGKALADLVDWGFITMIEKSKNQYSANIISINAVPKNGKARGKALDKATIKHGAKQGHGIGQGKDSIDKPLTIEPLTINQENASRSYFDNQELNDVFSNWMKMCGERGKPFAQSQIEALQMKLNTQSETKSINQVRQSLEKGWLNLRPYEETESKMSAQDEEEMDIAILKHLRDVQLEDDNPGTAENNRLRGIS